MRRPKRLLSLAAGAASVMVLASTALLIPSADATFPGHNGRIAFADFATGQIYTIDPDGSDLMQLTHVAAGVTAWSPTWSSNGKKIAFNNDVSGNARIWVMNSDGTSPHKVASDGPQYQDLFPRFAPDGKRILFARCPPDAGCGIYSVRIDGSDRRAITHFKDEVVDFFVSASPDGKRVAFSRLNAHGIIAQIYVKRLDGGRAHAVTPPLLEGAWPDWAPDGKGFNFSSAASRFHAQIFKWRMDTGRITALTDPPFPHNDQEGSYSPDGRQIVFVSDRGNPLLSADLYTMRSDGSHLKRIVAGRPLVGDPAWGPAGSTAARSAGGTSVTAKTTISPRANAPALARFCALQPKLVSFPQCKSARR